MAIDICEDNDTRPLLAHLMLGSLAAISGAAKLLSVRGDTLSEHSIQELLEMIARRADLLVESTQAMAGARPAEALAVLSQALAAA
jgi:nitrogen-specific signal transduction histidine kinase